MKHSKKKKDDSTVQLEDHLESDLLKQLKAVKSNLTKQQEEKEEALRQQKIKERKEREKNKSFEDLLNESSLNWEEYK
ncbi:YqkE family protein [Metabacillus fastidiosus]|uniref:YqkE family protein n=1 Tax=Metabacillus fastidiosus TaxID=1458 RepID=UPI002DBD53E1|nr:YqkE family protein [Metabacillus fastidiosus]MEC2075775.1 YqkE family protein [Metabacillus fastidiosus]MED4532290.1 YqkE family protein [Metabacillus fastidiosus]